MRLREDGRFMTSDGTSIHFTSTGGGPPLLLVPSFGFDTTLWEGMGLTVAVAESGRTAIAVEPRGHGSSDRPSDPARYGADRMARDLCELLDHLQIEHVDLLAYSMGSFVSLRLLQIERRVGRAVLGGIGASALRPTLFRNDLLPTGLDHDDALGLLLKLVPHLEARLRDGRADPQALIAILRAGFSPDDKNFRAVSASVLLLCGTDDEDPEPLAAAIPGAVVRRVEGDHGNALDNVDFAAVALGFLTAPSDVDVDAEA